MNVNGYEIGNEPTDKEHAIYRKVKAFNDRYDVALALKHIENYEGVRLTQDEFDTLCHRFGKLDFTDSVWNAVEWEYDYILDERGKR